MTLKNITLFERELPLDKDFEILIDEEVIKKCKNVDNQIQKICVKTNSNMEQ